MNRFLIILFYFLGFLAHAQSGGSGFPPPPPPPPPPTGGGGSGTSGGPGAPPPAVTAPLADPCTDSVTKSLEATRLSYYPEVATGTAVPVTIIYPMQGATYVFINEAGVSQEFTAPATYQAHLGVQLSAITQNTTYSVFARIGTNCNVTLPKITINVADPNQNATLTWRKEDEKCLSSGAIYPQMTGNNVSPTDYTYHLRAENETNYRAVPLEYPNGFLSLRAGNYYVKATHKTNNTTYESQAITLTHEPSAIEFTAHKLTGLCAGDLQDIVVKVTQGNYPMRYRLLSEDGSTEVRPVQYSNIFRDVPAGTYRVQVTDQCAADFGNASVKTITLDNSTFSIGDSSPWVHIAIDRDLNGCELNTFSFKAMETYWGNINEATMEFDAFPYPFTLKIEITSPDGKVYKNEVTVHNKAQREQLKIKRAPRGYNGIVFDGNIFPNTQNMVGEGGNWSTKLEFIACNGAYHQKIQRDVELYSQHYNMQNSKGLVIKYRPCGKPYVQLQGSRYNDQKLYVVLESYPPCYKPEENGGYKLNKFGDKYVMNYAQDYLMMYRDADVIRNAEDCPGDYTVRLVDDCGIQTPPLSINVPATLGPKTKTEFHHYRSKSCINNDRYDLLIHQYHYTQVKIESFSGDQSKLPFQLPLTLTLGDKYSYNNNWELKELPDGNYNISYTDKCNEVYHQPFVLATMKFDPNKVKVSRENCNVKIVLFEDPYYHNHLDHTQWILEWLDPTTDAWVPARHDAHQTNLGQVTNLNVTEHHLTGKFRILTLKANDGSAVQYCRRVVYEFEINADFGLQPYVVGYSCHNGKYTFKTIVKGGFPPYKYILQHNNTTVATSTDGFFKDIDFTNNQEYAIVVEDSCGSARTLNVNIATIKGFDITPDQTTYCVGSTATLRVPDLGADVTYTWYRTDQPNTALGTGHTYVISSVADADFANQYKVKATLNGITDQAIKDCIEKESTIQLVKETNATPLPVLNDSMAKQVSVCGTRYNEYNLKELLFPDAPAGGIMTDPTKNYQIPNSYKLAFNKGVHYGKPIEIKYAFKNQCGETSITGTITFVRPLDDLPHVQHMHLCLGENITYQQVEQRLRDRYQSELRIEKVVHFYPTSDDAKNGTNEITDKSQQIIPTGITNSYGRTIFFNISQTGFCNSNVQGFDIYIHKVDDSLGRDANISFCGDLDIGKAVFLIQDFLKNNIFEYNIYRKDANGSYVKLQGTYQLRTNEEYYYKVVRGGCETASYYRLGVQLNTPPVAKEFKIGPCYFEESSKTANGNVFHYDFHNIDDVYPYKIKKIQEFIQQKYPMAQNIYFQNVYGHGLNVNDVNLKLEAGVYTYGFTTNNCNISGKIQIVNPFDLVILEQLNTPCSNEPVQLRISGNNMGSPDTHNIAYYVGLEGTPENQWQRIEVSKANNWQSATFTLPLVAGNSKFRIFKVEQTHSTTNANVYSSCTSSHFTYERDLQVSPAVTLELSLTDACTAPKYRIVNRQVGYDYKVGDATGEEPLQIDAQGYITNAKAYVVAIDKNTNCRSEQVPTETTPAKPIVQKGNSSCDMEQFAVTNYVANAQYKVLENGVEVTTASVDNTGKITGLEVGKTYTIQRVSPDCTSDAFRVEAVTKQSLSVNSTAPTCTQPAVYRINLANPNNYTYVFQIAGVVQNNVQVAPDGTITGLQPSQTYEIIASHTAPNGDTCTGTPFSFTTDALPTIAKPVVTSTLADCTTNSIHTINGFDNAITYQLYQGNTLVTHIGTAQITGLTDGVTYTIKATQGTCVSENSEEFTYKAQLTVPSVPTISTTQATCGIGSIHQIDGYDATSGIDYEVYEKGSTNVLNITIEANGTISGLEVGKTYQVKAKQGDCYSGVSVDIVPQNALPIPADLQPNAQVVCPTTTDTHFDFGTLVQAQAGNTLRWYKDMTTNTPETATPTHNQNVTQKTEAVYYVTQVSAQGCESNRVKISLTIDDTQAPTFVNAPTNIALACNDPNFDQKVTQWIDSVTATDTCIGNVVVQNNYQKPANVCTQGRIEVTFTISDTFGNTHQQKASILLLVAVDDDFTTHPISSAGGEVNDNGTPLNVLTNDKRFGNTPDVSQVTIHQGTSNSINVNIDESTGKVVVSPNTPEGIYQIEYSICDKTTNVCSETAIVKVKVSNAPIEANDDNLGPINGKDGGKTTSILDNDTLNGVPVNTNDIVINKPNMPTGMTLNDDGTITIDPNTPAGTHTITYEICEKTNPTNCDNATITIEVTAPKIEANDDNLGPINGKDGGKTTSILDNDTLNGVPVNTNDIVINKPNMPTGMTLNDDGTITIDPNTPAGTHTITYEICEKTNPTNCNDAIITIEVTAPKIEANDDNLGPINGKDGGKTTSILDNDTLNGVPVNTNDIVIKKPNMPTGMTLNDDGTITIDPNTPAGTHTITYEICEKTNPTNCNDATITIEVTAPKIEANDDNLGPINGKDGGKTTSILDNDTLNGVPVNTNDIVIKKPNMPTGMTLNDDGTITIDPNTPAGTHTITYQICEKTNPTNCNDATITIEVTAPRIEANDDIYTIDSEDGGTTTSIFKNDLLNGNPFNTADVIFKKPNNLPTEIVVNDDGTITVAPNTPAGTYTFTYDICDAINTTSCSTAKVSVLVVKASNEGILDLVKVVDKITEIKVGAKIIYRFVATNNGTEVLSSVKLSDPKIGIINKDIPDLQPKRSVDITFEYQIQQSDIDLGKVVNTAFVTAKTPKGDKLRDDSDNNTPTIDEDKDGDTGNDPTITILRKIQANPDRTIYSNEKGGTIPNFNVLKNDTLDGHNSVNENNVTLETIEDNSSGMITINPDGSVNVSPNTPSKLYELKYKICDKVSSLCSSTTLIVEVVDDCELRVYNGLSLNRDGQNESLYIENIECYPDNVVRIFNRWGVEVFNTENYDNVNNLFEGFSNGRVTLKRFEKLPQGTYYIVIEYKTGSGEINRKGTWIYIKTTN